MYKFKQYEIITNKYINNNETRIVTLSDLNWNNDITKYDINDIIVSINDLYPKYLFILGNITNYKTLQDVEFQNKLNYFFDLLSSITNTYLVFGKKDYEYDEDNSKYIQIDNLISIYKKYKVNTINNSIHINSDTNILGLNLEPNKHYNCHDKKKIIKELIDNYNNQINNSNLNILLTHANLSCLKNELDILSYFDLIISKSSYNISKPSLFKKKEIRDEIFNKLIIENKGIFQKQEMDFIKIKKL